MDALHRFERRSLRDVLVAQGLLTEDVADELVNTARETNETFGAALVDSGHVTAWDLAKTVGQHFNLPCLPLAGFDVDRSLLAEASSAVLYQYLVLPVGSFGRVRSFAVAEPPSRDCLEALHEAFGTSLFFFVAEIGELRRLLEENVKVVDTKSDDSWQAIFDVAEENVLGGGS